MIYALFFLVKVCLPITDQVRHIQQQPNTEVFSILSQRSKNISFINNSVDNMFTLLTQLQANSTTKWLVIFFNKKCASVVYTALCRLCASLHGTLCIKLLNSLTLSVISHMELRKCALPQQMIHTTQEFY